LSDIIAVVFSPEWFGGFNVRALDSWVYDVEKCF